MAVIDVEVKFEGSAVLTQKARRVINATVKLQRTPEEEKEDGVKSRQDSPSK